MVVAVVSQDLKIQLGYLSVPCPFMKYATERNGNKCRPIMPTFNLLIKCKTSLIIEDRGSNKRSLN